MQRGTAQGGGGGRHDRWHRRRAPPAAASAAAAAASNALPRHRRDRVQRVVCQCGSKALGRYYDLRRRYTTMDHERFQRVRGSESEGTSEYRIRES